MVAVNLLKLWMIDLKKQFVKKSCTAPAQRLSVVLIQRNVDFTVDFYAMIGT